MRKLSQIIILSVMVIGFNLNAQSVNQQNLTNNKDTLSLTNYSLDILGKNSMQIYTSSREQEIPNRVGGGNHDGAGMPYINGNLKQIIPGIFICYNHKPISRCRIGGLIQFELRNLPTTGQARFTKVVSRKLYRVLTRGMLSDEFESVRFTCSNQETCAIQIIPENFNIKTHFR